MQAQAKKTANVVSNSFPLGSLGHSWRSTNWGDRNRRGPRGPNKGSAFSLRLSRQANHFELVVLELTNPALQLDNPALELYNDSPQRVNVTSNSS